MGFLLSISNEDRASLSVAFMDLPDSATYYNGDSIAAAIDYFRLYRVGNELFQKSMAQIAFEDSGISFVNAKATREELNILLSDFSDEEAVAHLILYPAWRPGLNVIAGMRYRHKGYLYKVLLNHLTDTLNAPSVSDKFEKINFIPPWYPPEDDKSGYDIGDQVKYGDFIYESESVNNCYPPNVAHAPWKNLTTPQPSTGVPVFPTWVPRQSYEYGACVEYEGKYYFSNFYTNTTTPGTRLTWTEIDAEGNKIIPEWQEGQIYQYGDHVMLDGIEYECHLDNNTLRPTTDDTETSWAVYNTDIQIEDEEPIEGEERTEQEIADGVNIPDEEE